MKKLVVIFMILTFAMVSCGESGPMKGTTTRPTQQFEDYTLVIIDGEICTVWDYLESTDSYRLIPIHRRTENGFRVKSKYLKKYTPQ